MLNEDDLQRLRIRSGRERGDNAYERRPLSRPAKTVHLSQPVTPSSTPIKPIPAACRKDVSYPTYYPVVAKLPTGYRLDKKSIDLPASNIIVYAIDYGQGQHLSVSLQPKPSASTLTTFNHDMSAYATLATPIGPAAGLKTAIEPIRPRLNSFNLPHVVILLKIITMAGSLAYHLVGLQPKSYKKLSRIILFVNLYTTMLF